jgi:2-polyprenyl-3-methyl-5-hydroxy-6-metoxy-1,4-benzoquinol methylase
MATTTSSLGSDGQCVHRDDHAEVVVSELPSGRRRVRVRKLDADFYVPYETCETAYPVALIRTIVAAKGSAFLIDEILRDESPNYVQHDLKWGLLSYLDAGEFAGKRILDFGCGSGGSTATLARMFPQSEIIGIELEERLLAVARARATHYRLSNVRFCSSPDGDRLPDGIGLFDFVVLSAVYEHLLPNERRTVLPLLWHTLKPGGILFLNGTPNRQFPLEMHTTGLPVINYLPDQLALLAARKLSRRNLENASWEALLRAGIRGGTIGEIVGNLRHVGGAPQLLEPRCLGIEDRIDLWLALSSDSVGRRRSSLAIFAKRLYRLAMKPLKALAGVEFLPELALALKKAG